MPTSTAITPYPHEQNLYTILAVFAGLFWLALTISTVGLILAYLLLFYLLALATQSSLIAYLQGNAVRIDSRQFPDLAERIEGCCSRLGMASVPEAYLMSGNGLLNAFATRFLRRYYIILLSDIVDALDDKPDAINFYIGHELGHIERKHIAHGWWLAPALVLPVLGSAYRRSQEYTCDRYGLACCPERSAALFALAVLAAGTQRWKTLNQMAFLDQCQHTGGFWMSLNELLSDYPWLCKRMAQLSDTGHLPPRRHPGAWLIALLLPRLGPGGAASRLVFLFALIGLLAAVALPAYRDYTQRPAIDAAFGFGRALTLATATFYEQRRTLPPNLEQFGLSRPESVYSAELDQSNGEITLLLEPKKHIVYTPRLASGKVHWSCRTDIAAGSIPRTIDCDSAGTPRAPRGGQKPN